MLFEWKLAVGLAVTALSGIVANILAAYLQEVVEENRWFAKLAPRSKLLTFVIVFLVLEVSSIYLLNEWNINSNSRTITIQEGGTASAFSGTISIHISEIALSEVTGYITSSSYPAIAIKRQTPGYSLIYEAHKKYEVQIKKVGYKNFEDNVVLKITELSQPSTAVPVQKKQLITIQENERANVFNGELELYISDIYFERFKIIITSPAHSENVFESSVIEKKQSAIYETDIQYIINVIGIDYFNLSPNMTIEVITYQ